jgi:hypothetical protein
VELGNGSHAGSRLPSILLTMRKRGDGVGTAIKLSVQGSDRQWVGGMVDLLSNELAKGVP